MGGGGKSLDDPSKGKKTPENKQEITSYTFKTYEDYFIDNFNLPEETYTRDAETNAPTINYSLITTKTENGEIKLLYNNNVFYVVTADDLTGSGSQSYPYLVNSTKGFWYLYNNSFSKLSLVSKFIKLNNDIYLNDETFDKKGNPSGGDGIVYDWYHTVNFTSGILLGNYHTIYGMYINQPSKGCSLFRSNGMINVIKDLTVSDFYIVGGWQCATLALKANLVENCTTLKGAIAYNGRYNAGIVENANEIRNCVNYADVGASNSEAAGITIYSKKIINCKNYGNITGASSGGIASRKYDTTLNSHIESCVNYGNISGNYSGGILSVVYNGCFGFVTNCKNYGNINGVECAGIVGVCSANANLIISNCKNYGKTSSTGNRGAPITATIYANANCLIDSCFSTSNESMPFRCATNAYLTISNSIFICYNAPGRSMIGDGNVFITNTLLSFTSEKTSKTLFLFDKQVNVFLDNVIFDVNIQLTNLNLFQQGVFNVEDVIVFFNQNNQKEYYGSNFSGFYYSWKLGKIGLIALDGRGAFQGKIDEEWLLNKGFEKKSL